VIRVAVVDDQQLVREGFAMILSAQPDVEVAVLAEDGRAFLAAVRADPRLDVALVDVRMPVLDGLAATRALQALRGFLLKRCSGADLVRAVRAVADGDSILSPEVTRAVLARVRAAGPHGAQDLSSYGLSPREADVLALIGLGLNNTEIAARLHLSTSTVKTHVGSVLAKTHSRDRVQAALLASRAGLLPS
jgi:DNA-binding NarL/FixJ family response regulator